MQTIGKMKACGNPLDLRNLMINEKEPDEFDPILDWIKFPKPVRLSEFSNILTHYIKYYVKNANSIPTKEFSLR